MDSRTLTMCRCQAGSSCRPTRNAQKRGSGGWRSAWPLAQWTSSLRPALSGPGLKARSALGMTRSRMLSAGRLQEGTRVLGTLRPSSSAPSCLPSFSVACLSPHCPLPAPPPAFTLPSFCLSLRLLVHICDWSGCLALCPDLYLHPCLLSWLFSPISVSLSCLSISLSCFCLLPDSCLSPLFSWPPFYVS